MMQRMLNGKSNGCTEVERRGASDDHESKKLWVVGRNKGKHPGALPHEGLCETCLRCGGSHQVMVGTKTERD